MTSEEKTVMRKNLEEKLGYPLKEVAELLLELINEQKGITHHEDAVYDKLIEMRVTDILKEIGMPVNLLGYQYVRTAIIMAYNDPELMEAMTKEFYPKLAIEYGTTWRRIQTGIRNAIVAVYTRGDMKAMDKYFGENASRPTNSKFIATIVDFLDMN